MVLCVVVVLRVVVVDDDLIISQVLRGALGMSLLARQAARWSKQMLSYKTPSCPQTGVK